VRCGADIDLCEYAIEMAIVYIDKGAKTGRPVPVPESFPNSVERKYIHVDCLAEDDLGVELGLFEPGYDEWNDEEENNGSEQMGPT
jgi:hypothetical protein